MALPCCHDGPYLADPLFSLRSPSLLLQAIVSDQELDPEFAPRFPQSPPNRRAPPRFGVVALDRIGLGIPRTFGDVAGRNELDEFRIFLVTVRFLLVTFRFLLVTVRFA